MVVAAASAYDPEAWHDFFVMLGSAAAAITGLIFIGLSIHLRTISATSVLRERARFLIVGVMSIVVFAALGLVPQGREALGLEILGLALALAIAVARLLTRSWPVGRV